MYFIVNNVSVDYQLDKLGLGRDEKTEWIERFRDDFNERVDNGEIVQLLLSLPRSRLQAILDGSVDDAVNQLEPRDVQEKKDLATRLNIFAKIIDTDMVNYERFINARNKEPELMARFDYCYLTDSHLVVMFEEFEE